MYRVIAAKFHLLENVYTGEEKATLFRQHKDKRAPSWLSLYFIITFSLTKFIIYVSLQFYQHIVVDYVRNYQMCAAVCLQPVSYADK